jgi:hypothetical protein
MDADGSWGAVDTYLYDAAGRVTSETQQIPIPGSSPITVTLADQYTAGNRTQLKTAIGGTYDFLNNYEYAFYPANNLYGQMSQVTQTDNGGNSVTTKSVGFSYYYDGQFNTVSRSDYASNEVITGCYGYDSAGRLNAIWYAKGDVLYDGFQYVYDPAGDISDEYSLVDTAGTPTLDPTTWNHVQYAYDATHQLTGESYSQDTVAPANRTFRYDPNGNLQSAGQPNQGVGTDNEQT